MGVRKAKASRRNFEIFNLKNKNFYRNLSKSLFFFFHFRPEGLKSSARLGSRAIRSVSISTPMHPTTSHLTLLKWAAISMLHIYVCHRLIWFLFFIFSEFILLLQIGTLTLTGKFFKITNKAFK